MWNNFIVVLLGLGLSLEYLPTVWRVVAYCGTLIVISCIFVFNYPPTREWTVDKGKVVGTWFAGQVGYWIISNTDAIKDFNTVILQSLKTLKEVGVTIRELFGGKQPSVKEAKLNNDVLIIPFRHGRKDWELAVSFDSSRSRMTERPFVVTDVERQDYPLHHPAIPFYLGSVETEWE
jgi:hypothetical protein